MKKLIQLLVLTLLSATASFGQAAGDTLFTQRKADGGFKQVPVTKPGSGTKVFTIDSTGAYGASTFGTGTITSITLTQPAAGITITGTGSAITSTGTPTFALANDLAGVEGLSGTGLAARTATDTWATRTLTGTSNKIDIANGDGVSGNPTFTMSSTYVGQSSITTLGTIASGTWNGGVIGAVYGGTGLTSLGTGISTFLSAGSSFTFNGTAGAGFLGLPNQSSAPSTPGSGLRIYSNNSGYPCWINSSGYVETLSLTLVTANRTITIPDSSGVMALTNGTIASATTADGLTNGRTISISGDLTYTSPSFNGTGNVTAAGTLANTAVTPGSYTSANITVNSKGLVTAAANGSGSGDVVGPGSATDNAIARFDSTTGKVIQNSAVTIADTSGNMAGVGTINTNTIPAGTSTFAMLGASQTLTGANTFSPSTDVQAVVIQQPNADRPGLTINANVADYAETLFSATNLGSPIVRTYGLGGNSFGTEINGFSLPALVVTQADESSEGVYAFASAPSYGGKLLRVGSSDTGDILTVTGNGFGAFTTTIRQSVASANGVHLFADVNSYSGNLLLIDSSEFGAVFWISGNGAGLFTVHSGSTLDLTGNNITSVADPVNAQDAETKAHVATLIAPLAPLASPALTGSPTAATLQIGAGATIDGILIGTNSDATSVPAGSFHTSVVSVSGATTGSMVIASGDSVAATANGLIIAEAYVSATNVVSVIFYNPDLIAAHALNSNLRAMVIKAH